MIETPKPGKIHRSTGKMKNKKKRGYSSSPLYSLFIDSVIHHCYQSSLFFSEPSVVLMLFMIKIKGPLENFL